MSQIPKFPKLAALAGQTDPLEARRVLLESLDIVIETCRTQQRMTNGGDYYDTPDTNGIVKALELAGRITGSIGIDPAVLIQFKNDTAKLVERAQKVLHEKERSPALVAHGEEAPARKVTR